LDSIRDRNLLGFDVEKKNRALPRRPGVSAGGRGRGEGKAPTLLGRSKLGRGGGKLGRGERNGAGPRGEVQGASFFFFLFFPFPFYVLKLSFEENF